MAERTSEVRTFLIERECDICGKGDLKPAGDIVLTSHPPLFPHRCESCGASANFPEKYPRIFYRIIGEV
jgi:hypothetical protein